MLFLQAQNGYSHCSRTLLFSVTWGCLTISYLSAPECLRYVWMKDTHWAADDQGRPQLCLLSLKCWYKQGAGQVWETGQHISTCFHLCAHKRAPHFTLLPPSCLQVDWGTMGWAQGAEDGVPWRWGTSFSYSFPSVTGHSDEQCHSTTKDQSLLCSCESREQAVAWSLSVE